MTIIISNTHVSFQLGIGLVSKSYNISDLKSCKSVTNSVLNGIGIRMLSNGWLYNVSGLKAIELQFRNSKSVIRIGTDRPEEISELIQLKISGEPVANESAETETKKWINPLWVILILLVVGSVIIPNYTETRISVGANEFTIKGVYGLMIPYSQIEQVDTVSRIPKVSVRTNGYSFGKTSIGNFKFADGSHTKLFIKKGFPPYLMIKSKGSVPVYINFTDRQKTIDLYNNLKTKNSVPGN